MSRRSLGILIVAVILFDVAAFIVAPPFPHGQPGAECGFPECFITSSLEFPEPHVVLGEQHLAPSAASAVALGFEPTITNSILTLWIVGGLLLLLALAARARGFRDVPGGLQNLLEWAYESLENFAISIGGLAARPHVPIYAAFFLLILFSNWSGLLPPVGRIEFFRAPTSDVNVTLGLALFAFGYFQFQGFRANGVFGYLSRFFPVKAFREGIGAGVIAIFVGLIELLLEFVKPVTLSMRLFGNIYGGEVALGAITALTIAIIPAAMFGLELILNFIQALIFSVLMLIFTTLAIESHEEGHDDAEEAAHMIEEGVHGAEEMAHGTA
jgi:F-type H+-transporting ATPase subunit a